MNKDFGERMVLQNVEEALLLPSWSFPLRPFDDSLRKYLWYDLFCLVGHNLEMLKWAELVLVLRTYTCIQMKSFGLVLC